MREFTLLNLARSLSSTEQGNPAVRIKHKEVLVTLGAAETGTKRGRGSGERFTENLKFCLDTKSEQRKNQVF
jgi:hypothetical protein